eukprot:gene3124-4430_t
MGGMPVVTAVQLSGALLPVERQADLHQALTDIQAGQPLSTSLARHQLTTAVAERLLRVGEQSGELAAMCERIAQFHDEALERAIELFSKVFEPLLMLVVGGLIGLIVFIWRVPSRGSAMSEQTRQWQALAAQRGLSLADYLREVLHTVPDQLPTIATTLGLTPI